MLGHVLGLKTALCRTSCRQSTPWLHLNRCFPARSYIVPRSKTGGICPRVDIYCSHTNTQRNSGVTVPQYGFLPGLSSILTVAQTLRAATDWPAFSIQRVRLPRLVTLNPMHSFSQILVTWEWAVVSMSVSHNCFTPFMLHIFMLPISCPNFYLPLKFYIHSVIRWFNRWQIGQLACKCQKLINDN